MPFKGLSRLMLLPMLGSSLLMSSCSQFLNEEKKKDQVIQLSDAQFRCLETWPSVIRDFSTGAANERQIRPAFRCLGQALTYFGERTKGSLPDAYTAADLRRFFGKYFLEQKNIPPELAQGFLRLKQALFGGSDRFVTKTELSRVVSLLQVLEDEVVNLSPHVQVYTTQKGLSVVTDQSLHSSVRQLRASLQNLLSQVELVRSDYQFEEAKLLISQIGEFARETSPLEVFDHVSAWIPTIQSLKVVFFGERASLRGQREWADALDTVIDLYDMGLRYHYLMREGLFDSPAQMRNTLNVGDRLLSLLENSHQMRSTGRLPFHHLDEVIDRILEKNLLKVPLTASTIKSLYRKIVLTMLDPVRRGDSRGADAMERVHLVSMRREFNIFRVNQMFNDDIGNRDLSISELRRAFERFDLNGAVRRVSKDPLEDQALKLAWGKYKELMLKRRASNFDRKGRIYLLVSPESVRWTWYARSRFNLMHLFTRGFMLGYGDHPNPTEAACDEAGLIRWYADFTDFGREIKAFDPRSGNSGARSFKEASFFTASGNGDNRVDMDEMFDFISVLFSAGMTNANDIRNHLESASVQARFQQSTGRRCVIPDLDVFGLHFIDEACFQSELRGQITKLFPNTPGLTHYIESLDDETWNQFYGFLMAAAKSEVSRETQVDTSDIRTAVMVLHYTEALFTVYDTDQNQVLSQQELLVASDRFIPFLRTLSPVQNETFVREAFLALVYQGVKPGAWDMTRQGTGRLWNWLWGSEGKTADRMNILRVFGNLKAELEASSPPSP